ncbi:MAG: hypothetical protein IPM23_21470 [Candidatus Melainabacteria bacterium]|nr:hypothetical protein [Candidatus Melainabacteria bacterium]
MTEEQSDNLTDHLEVPGSILTRLVMRLNLARTHDNAVLGSALLFIAVTFVPILVLSVIDGFETGGLVDMPLHEDLITLSRYLIAAPILILSDRLTRPWLVKAVLRFLELVDKDEIEAFKKMLRRIFQIRGSALVDLVILVVCIASSFFLKSYSMNIEVSSWQTGIAGGVAALSRPGFWNTFVSQPLFRFVVMSWTVDYILWIYFLWRASRFRLKLYATHPDRAGGLSFVSAAHSQFCLAAFAIAAADASVVAQLVQHTHQELESFYRLGLVFLGVILLFFVGPLLVFSPTLLRTRLDGIISYGALCHELSDKFAGKWLRKRGDKEESILASLDPSSLADLNSSFSTVLTMRPVVFDHQFVILFVVATCLPALPLIATVIPLQDLVVEILKALT